MLITFNWFATHFFPSLVPIEWFCMPSICTRYPNANVRFSFFCVWGITHNSSIRRGATLENWMLVFSSVAFSWLLRNIKNCRISCFHWWFFEILRFVEHRYCIYLIPKEIRRLAVNMFADISKDWRKLLLWTKAVTVLWWSRIMHWLL